MAENKLTIDEMMECLNKYEGHESAKQLIALLEELKQYKEAEKQGLILRVPCKMGENDKVLKITGNITIDGRDKCYSTFLEGYDLGMFLDLIEEYRKYQEIGTVEACRIAIKAGISDKNCSDLKVGDKVSLFGKVGKVIYDSGAYGIYFEEGVPWELIKSKMLELAPDEQIQGVAEPHFCYDKKFVSFWELIWNFNYIPGDSCEVVKKIKKNDPALDKEREG